MSLGKWRFSSNEILISGIFYSSKKDFDFRKLDGWWTTSHDNAKIKFYYIQPLSKMQTFVASDDEDHFTKPSWYDQLNNDSKQHLQ